MSSFNVSDVCLINPYDAAYRAFVARRRAEQAAMRLANKPVEDRQFSVPTGGPGTACSPAPPVGRLVEKAIGQWIGCQIKLECNRILTWREQQMNFERRRRYAELDFVHRADYDTLVLFETKFTTEEWMLEQKGVHQLLRAQRLLQRTPSGRNTLTRLVYVGDGSLHNPNVPVVNALDRETPHGVIWVDASTVEAIAGNRGAAMPDGWLDRPHQASRPWLHA